MTDLTNTAVVETPPTIDLSKPLALGELLRTTFRLYRQRPLLFLLLALIVVVPVDFFASGFLLGELENPFAEIERWRELLYNMIVLGIMVPLITGSHAMAVLAMSEGRRPTLREALRQALPVFPAVGIALVISAIATGFALLALVIPGIYLAVRWAVIAPAGAVERTGAAGALGRSWDLTDGRWWWMFRVSLVLNIVGGAVALLGGLPLYFLGVGVDSGLIWVAGTIVIDTIVYSFTALGLTLAFFSLRAWQTQRPRRDPSDIEMYRRQLPVETGSHTVVRWVWEAEAKNGEGIGSAWVESGAPGFSLETIHRWDGQVPRSEAERYAAENGYDFEPDDQD